MPDLPEPQFKNYNYRIFNTWHLDNLDSAIKNIEDHNLKVLLIEKRNMLCDSIKVLDGELHDKVRKSHYAAKQLSEVMDEATLQQRRFASDSCFEDEKLLANMGELINQLDEIYMAGNTTIETKDKLYELRQTARSILEERRRASFLGWKPLGIVEALSEKLKGLFGGN